METITVIDVLRTKLNVKDINKIGIGKPPVVYIFLEHISENRVVYIPDLCMELFSADAIRTVVGMDIVRIQLRTIASTVISRIFQEVLAGHIIPYE